MSSANNPEEIIQRQLPPFSTRISSANNPEGIIQKKTYGKDFSPLWFQHSAIRHLPPISSANSPKGKYEGKIQGKTLKNNHR